MMDSVRTMRMRLASSRRGRSSTAARSQTRNRRLGLPLALAVLAALAPPVRAHPSDPSVYTIVDAVEPAVPGLTIQVQAGVADQLFVVNDTAEPLDVLDDEGRVFLRIGPSDVRADVRSIAWRTSLVPFGRPFRGGPAPDRGELVRVAPGRSWGWFDHRLHPESYVPPRDARTVTRLAEWTVPLRHAGTPVTVRGHVEHRPVTGSVLTRHTHAPPGVTADVLNGKVPGLLLRWTGSGSLAVQGEGDEPFARFTARSAEVNTASRTWQDDQRLRGNDIPIGRDRDTPDWQPAADEPQLSWLDRRLSYAPGVPPAAALRATRPTTLVEWEIPVVAGGVRDSLRGVTEWVPAATAGGDGRSRLPYALGAGAVLVAAIVGLRRKLTER
jgi:hypothetical protein